MANINKLSDIVNVNENFRNAINLYLNLNKKDKILSYIPTQSSVRILKEYLISAYDNKEQATLLIGPYGKGKSHLLLILLSILSMKRTKANEKIINHIKEKISRLEDIGVETSELITEIWENRCPFLPVIIMSSQNDLQQSFLYALSEALKREGIDDLIPDTFYSVALNRIEDWKNNYPHTFHAYEKELYEYQKTVADEIADLRKYSMDSLERFKKIYPKITSGGEFNPLVQSEVLPLYRSVSDKLKEYYNYDGIYVVFDEFSKFIEGQNSSRTGNNMKLLQDICELANESKNTQIHITMIAHKSIKEYGKYLSKDIINSFTGIEGRIEEKYYVTSSKNNYELIQNAIIKDTDKLLGLPQYELYLGKNNADKYYNIPFFHSNFNREDFDRTILKGCYPLNPLCAYLLLNISEKVAQNERTLFTFISKDEQYSMARFIGEHDHSQEWIIGADLIYDYFGNLFRKDVTNELVHNEWLNAEYALSKCENETQKKVIKSLAAILIVNRSEEVPANGSSIGLAANIEDWQEILTQLESKDIITKKASTDCYVFKTRAGSVLKKEIKKRSITKAGSINISKILQDITDRLYVIPKRYNTLNCITRYFSCEYMEIETFLSIQNMDTIINEQRYSDGKVVILYSLDRTIDIQEIKDKLNVYASEKLIIVYTLMKFEYLEQAREYEIIQELKKDYAFIDNHEIMTRELPLLEEDLANELLSYHEKMYEGNEGSGVLFYFKGKLEERKVSELEKAVNLCCEVLYEKAPVINNEVIYRKELTTAPTKKARKVIIEAILNHKDNEEFYKGSGQEATIYRSLFVVTRIVTKSPDKRMKEVLGCINSFIEDCADNKQYLCILMDKLTDTPYGLRASVLPIYIAYVLSQRREDVLVYMGKYEYQLSTEIIINMCDAPDQYELFVSKESIEKEKYVCNLQKLFRVVEHSNLSNARLSNILSCIQRWFRGLPQVTRNIMNDKRYSDSVAIFIPELKKVLIQAELNPYEILFKIFPEIFNTKENLASTFSVLKQCKISLDGYYEWLISRATEETFKVFGTKTEDLYHVLKEWYERQSDISKKGLHNRKMTSFMSCIDKINIYDDREITKKLAKSISEVYIENWNEYSLDNYLLELINTKTEIEMLKEQSNDGKKRLIFTNRSGKEITRYYDSVNENTGSVLRNVLEDTLDEFVDLGVNDKVAILLEMIEKVME